MPRAGFQLLNLRLDWLSYAAFIVTVALFVEFNYTLLALSWRLHLGLSVALLVCSCVLTLAIYKPSNDNKYLEANGGMGAKPIIDYARILRMAILGARLSYWMFSRVAVTAIATSYLLQVVASQYPEIIRLEAGVEDIRVYFAVVINHAFHPLREAMDWLSQIMGFSWPVASLDISHRVGIIMRLTIWVAAGVVLTSALKHAMNLGVRDGRELEKRLGDLGAAAGDGGLRGKTGRL